MSSIDQYIYTCIGIIKCPLAYRFFHGPDIIPIHVAIYRLRQDIPEVEDDFQGKNGDILVGGGHGESPTMRIRIPEALLFFTDMDHYDREFPDTNDDIYSFYWSPNETYMLCSGYETLGWDPEDQSLGHWLTKHVLSFLLEHYRDDYIQWVGEESIEYDGSICRKLTDEEDKVWNWKTYRYGI